MPAGIAFAWADKTTKFNELPYHSGKIITQSCILSTIFSKEGEGRWNEWNGGMEIKREGKTQPVYLVKPGVLYCRV
jgi:hypothetical protein